MILYSTYIEQLLKENWNIFIVIESEFRIHNWLYINAFLVSLAHSGGMKTLNDQSFDWAEA